MQMTNLITQEQTNCWRSDSVPDYADFQVNCNDHCVISKLIQCPLIAPRTTLRGCCGMLPLKGGNVYFGTGVATTSKMSSGMPFDCLGMMLVAERVRQASASSYIIHEISDTHALTNDFCDPDVVSHMANMQREKYNAIAKSLGIKDAYFCILASEYRRKIDFRKIQEEVDALSPKEAPAYLRYQSAGNLYFARHFAATKKIGWLIDDDDKVMGYDERRFNESYAQLGLMPLNYIYTWSGWTFDTSRTRVSPYTYVDGEKRLKISSNKATGIELLEMITQCRNQKIINKVTSHLTRLVDEYDRICPYNVYKKLNDNSAREGFIDCANSRNYEIDINNITDLIKGIDGIRRNINSIKIEESAFLTGLKPAA